MDRIEYHVQEEGKLAILSLNRKDKLNALNKNLLDELRRHLERIAQNPNVGLLVLQSELTQAFCSGIDVAYVQTLTNEQAAQFFVELAATLEIIINFPVPTVAVVRGYAFGAGADLALACDLRIGGQSATFRFPGPQFGLVLGTKRLIHEVGPSKARAITLMNKTLDSHQALHDGLLHMVCDDDQCLELAYIQAKNLLNIPNSSLDPIRKLCKEDEGVEDDQAMSVYLTQQSVMEGNFQEKFARFLQKTKQSTKTEG